MDKHGILLDHDDGDRARLLTAEMEDLGDTRRVAGSVMDGVMQARERAPDLLLLELGLPAV